MSLKRDAKTIEDAMSSVSEELARTRPVENVETGVLDVAFGTVIWVRYVIDFSGDSDTALPSHLMAYVVMLGSEGTLVIHSVGVQSDDSHRELLDGMLATLRRHETLLPRRPPLPWIERVDGTDVRLRYPEAFIPVPLDALKTSLADQVDKRDPEVVREIRRPVDGIAGGILRAYLSSSRPLGSGRNIRILVHRDVDDLDEAVDRTLGYLGDPRILARQEVELPLGPAVRVRLPVAGSNIPAFDDLYVMLIDHGLSMTIQGRAAESDAEFESLLRKFVESLEYV